MIEPSNVSAPRSWTSVGKWTLFGTIFCVTISLAVTWLLLGEQEADVTGRVLISATLVPTLVAAPLFFYFSLRMRQLAIVNTKLGRVARTDSLTACLNRGAFTARVNDWLRNPSTIRGALLMIDADNFKAINDAFGHDAGDEALTLIARSVRTVLRNGDIVGRLGGEEFGVFLPDVDHDRACQVAERIRAEVAESQFAPDGDDYPLSVSVGGAVFSRNTSFAELFRLADQRLYSAKRAGRNAVTVDEVADHPIIRLKRSA